MQEIQAPSAVVSRPASVFRAALAAAAAKERSSRARRPDRVQAIAGLTDGDLVALVREFEQHLHGPADANAMAASLYAALQALSPDAPADEVRDA